MIIAIIISSIILFLLLVFFIVLFILYRFVFYSPRKGQINDFNLEDSKQYKGFEDRIKNLITNLKKEPYKDVYIDSFDGYKLRARRYDNSSSNRVAILCHGYRGTAYRDFCGGAREVLDKKMNLLLIDHRGHGLSKGHSITFGVRETKDVLKWIEYAKKEFGEDKQIVLVGISMGGFTVLNCADKVNDNTIIIADCPYTSPRQILENSIKSIHLPIKFFYALTNLSSILFAHTNLNKVDAYESIKNTQCKILIIHGDKDSVVPFECSKKLAETYPHKIRYELFPAADHGMSYVVDTDRYKKIISEFLK